MNMGIKLTKLFYVRCRSGSADGAEIFDNKIISSLRSIGVVVREIDVGAGSSFDVLRRLISGVPPIIGRYAGNSYLINNLRGENVVFSHESLIPMACEAADANNVAIILHNIWSMIDDENRFSYLNLIKPLMARYEKILLSNKSIGVCVLSTREKQIVDGQAGIDCMVVPPGVPRPAIDPNEQDLIDMPILISGSSGWRLKQRDMNFVIDRINDDKLLNCDIYTDFDCEKIKAKSMQLWDSGKSMAIGLVPDRFIAGFKLKIIWYIANNCVVISNRSFSDEFMKFPYGEKYVYTLRSGESYSEAREKIIKNFSMREFLEFKKSIIEYYSWGKSAEVIKGYFS